MKLTMKLVRDDDAQSPQDNSDDHETGALFLVTTRNRYFQVDHPLVPRDGNSYAISEDLKASHHIYPLFAYIHSGVVLSLGEFGDRWDSGQIGHVFVTRDTNNVTDPRKSAEGLVEEWNHFLSGDVWGFVIKDEDGATVDSCWGFYGQKYATEEGEMALKAATEATALAEMKHTQLVCR